MTDKRTIDVYNQRVEDYAKFVPDEPSADMQSFAAALPAAATVLDLGCGPGHAAAHFASLGHTTHAWDASSEMIALASRHPKVLTRQTDFDALTQTAEFDGIWASFSLLHALRADFPRYLAAAHTALKPGGLLYLGMKLGTGEGPDKIGRFYTYYEEGELLALLTSAGFTVTQRRTGREAGLSGEEAPFMVLFAHG